MRITVFDTETTGLPAREGGLEQQPYVIQFASQTFDFDPQTRRCTDLGKYNQYIKPPINIPEESTRISGISDKTVSNSPDFASVSTEILEVFRQSDLAVAHNFSFDAEVLGYEMQRLGQNKDIFPPTTFDSMEGTRDLCKLPGKNGGYKAPKLMELHQFLLNESFQEAHNAINDVEALVRCVKVLLQQGLYQPVLNSAKETEVEQISLF